jgi:hypothetical protein
LLDWLYHEAALVEADEGMSSPADRRWARAMVGSIHERLAAMRRNLVPAAAPVVAARPVRAGLLAMGREALLAKLAAITAAMGDAVQYAHRDLAGLSDDDLRRVIDAVDPDGRFDG